MKKKFISLNFRPEIVENERNLQPNFELNSPVRSLKDLNINEI